VASGFRKFLGLPAKTPPSEPAELAPADGCPPGPLAGPTTQGDAAPIRDVAVDKKVELVSEQSSRRREDSKARVFVAKPKREVEPPRSRAGYVWRSQASREKRAAWADMPERF
jgi:hypothetical protein